MFGFKENRCVLRASRRALSSENGGEGHEAFGKFYNESMKKYEDLAEKYNIPLKYEEGERRTRKYQYDLLWIEFAKYGLEHFLDIEAEKEEKEKE